MVKGTLVLDDCEDRLTEEDLERCHLLINTTGVELQLDTGDLLSGGWVGCLCCTNQGRVVSVEHKCTNQFSVRPRSVFAWLDLKR